MKPVRGKGTLRLEAEIGKGMWESHQITAFLNLGNEKALTGFPPTLVCFFIWSTGCTARGCFSPMQGGIMRSRPSLTVYMIAGIDLGVLRHCAASCNIVRQLSGVDSRRQDTNDFLRGMASIPCKTDCLASSKKPVEWKRAHRQRLDQNHPL